jgi:uncharacterized protein (DUF2132 family)
MPTVDDLTPWARRLLEEAYTREGARREKCSREDFSAGYIEALVQLRSLSSFRSKEAMES